MTPHLKCVVLNTTHEPLSVIPAKRGLRLYRNGKATILKFHEDKFIRTVTDVYRAPSVIVLHTYVNRRIKTAILTRKNVFERDDYTCQYCMRSSANLRPTEFLTWDHIIPRSRGGVNSWTNLVTCCNTCNNKKGNSTAEEAGLKLAKPPVVPTLVDIWTKRFGI